MPQHRVCAAGCCRSTIMPCCAVTVVHPSADGALLAHWRHSWHWAARNAGPKEAVAKTGSKDDSKWTPRSRSLNRTA